MSKYRDRTPLVEVEFEELEILEKLLKSKKLTDKQREALRKLIQEHYSRE